MKQRGPTEAQIQQQCRDYLALDGWRLVVTDPPHIRGLGVSEPGMPDDLMIRYQYPCRGIGCSGEHCGTIDCVDAELLWIEYKCKRPGSKAAQHQKDWHDRERARGALVVMAGERGPFGFDASLEGFAEWYEKSGLQRKRVSVGGIR